MFRVVTMNRRNFFAATIGALVLPFLPKSKMLDYDTVLGMWRRKWRRSGRAVWYINQEADLARIFKIELDDAMERKPPYIRDESKLRFVFSDGRFKFEGFATHGDICKKGVDDISRKLARSAMKGEMDALHEMR